MSIATNQISLKQFTDPFTGETVQRQIRSCPRKGATSNPVAIGELFICLEALLSYALIGPVHATGLVKVALTVQ